MIRKITPGWRQSVKGWLDNDSYGDAGGNRIDWLRLLPFVGLHVACVAVFWTGTSGVALAVAAGSFSLRMLAITAFYHRYFSHKAFRVGRLAQFLMGVMGATATQRGPLWWAAHHRLHHREADGPNDPHSPRHGFWHSHVGWFLRSRNFRTRSEEVRDLAQYPELAWLDRYDFVVPVLYAAMMFGLGALLARFAPSLGTDGAQMLVWGYVISTVALYHATFCINSLAHRWGSRAHGTRDDSRNNLWLSLLTFGEGWHNNHHRFPSSARQGLRWWQWDPTWYLILGMEALGIARSLRRPPRRVTG